MKVKKVSRAAARFAQVLSFCAAMQRTKMVTSLQLYSSYVPNKWNAPFYCTRFKFILFHSTSVKWHRRREWMRRTTNFIFIQMKWHEHDQTFRFQERRRGCIVCYCYYVMCIEPISNMAYNNNDDRVWNQINYSIGYRTMAINFMLIQFTWHDKGVGRHSSANDNGCCF